MRSIGWLVAVAGMAQGCKSQRLTVNVELVPNAGPTWTELCDWYAQSEPQMAAGDLVTFVAGQEVVRPCTRPPDTVVSFLVERDRDFDLFAFQFHYRLREAGRVESDAPGVQDGGFGEITVETDAESVELVPVLEDCFTPGDDDGDGLTDWYDEPECTAEVACDRDRTGCRDLRAIAVTQGESGLYGWNQGEGTWKVDGRAVTAGAAFAPDAFSLGLRDLAPGRHTVSFEQDYPSPGFGSAVVTVPAETNQVIVPVLWTATCHDGSDQDGNGLTDCDDPACVDACRGAEDCADGDDDDGDGLVDCLDPDCAGEPHCLGGEDCTNGADDDCDALVDCADVADCGTHPTCLPEGVCDDGLDDDGDGNTDCADNDCSADPACVDTCGQALVVAGAYTKGGLGPLSWNQDFVEIGNRSDTPQDLSQVWLHVMDGLGNWYVFDVRGTVPAHGYYLVQLSGYGYNRALPAPDHVAGPFVPDLSESGSGVVLSSSATAAAVRQCPTAGVIDRLGFNGGVFCAEGYVGPSGSPSDTEGFRRIDTCVDTDDNAADFALTAMTAPRNSAVAGVSCGCP